MAVCASADLLGGLLEQAVGPGLRQRVAGCLRPFCERISRGSYDLQPREKISSQIVGEAIQLATGRPVRQHLQLVHRMAGIVCRL